MARYAAFLRGINVGGHRITNDELREACEAVGLADVATFRASGNVIFAAEDEQDSDAIADRIETGLGETLGYEVPVFLRTAPEVLAIAAHQPFPPELVEASAGKLQVSLLAAKPSTQARKTVLALADGEDRLAIRDRELYWLPSGGLLESELDLKTVDGALGTSTRRTKGTMEQVAAKFFAAAD
jgi:uncharacterized protein (DUF1697 family)